MMVWSGWCVKGAMERGVARKYSLRRWKKEGSLPIHVVSKVLSIWSAGMESMGTAWVS